jgi:uncharacterized coiled-coil protein SlyX
MEQLIKLIVDNGIGVICVAFLIYFINTTLKDNTNILTEMQKTLVSMQTTLSNLTQRVDKIEDKNQRKKEK